MRVGGIERVKTERCLWLISPRSEEQRFLLQTKLMKDSFWVMIIAVEYLRGIKMLLSSVTKVFISDGVDMAYK